MDAAIQEHDRREAEHERKKKNTEALQARMKQIENEGAVAKESLSKEIKEAQLAQQKSEEEFQSHMKQLKSAANEDINSIK